MKALILILLLSALCGCVGNKTDAKAEVTGLKIERKPSAGEEAKNYAEAIKTLWSRDNGSD